MAPSLRGRSESSDTVFRQREFDDDRVPGGEPRRQIRILDAIRIDRLIADRGLYEFRKLQWLLNLSLLKAKLAQDGLPLSRRQRIQQLELLRRRYLSCRFSNDHGDGRRR